MELATGRAVHGLPKSLLASCSIRPVSPAEWLQRHSRFILLGFLALGIAVRWRHYVAAPSYWYDEAYVLVNIFDKSFFDLTGPLRCEQAAPPLFLWTLRGLYLIFGGSEWVMRLPAAAASVLSVLVMFPLARRFVGAPGAHWAVGFVAVSQSARFNGNLVKPYALDLLATEIVFLAGALHLHAGANKRRTWAALLGLAVVLPWWSYPSIFALGGVCAALLADSIRCRRVRSGMGSLAVALAGFGSLAAVWLLVGRTQRSSFLAEYWQPFFFDTASLPSALEWAIGRLVKMGYYGTTGMGVPLLVLASFGALVLLRRKSLAVLMSLTLFFLMFVANALRFYPLEDRLFLFALPALWLLASAGIGGILERLHGRWSWLGAILLVVPLAAGAVRYGYWLVVVPSKVEFREAFAYVEQRQLPRDLWWVSHPEVYEVYFGTERKCLSGALDRTAVPLEPRPRLWLIATPGGGDSSDEHESIRRLTELGYVLRERKEFSTVRILLYAVPGP